MVMIILLDASYFTRVLVISSYAIRGGTCSVDYIAMLGRSRSNMVVKIIISDASHITTSALIIDSYRGLSFLTSAL